MAEPAPALNETDHETIDLLKDSAADFCGRTLSIARIRDLRGASPSFNPVLWREMCELGWSGIVVPESAAGLGLGMVAAGAVCRELGRVVATEPMIESGVVATTILSRSDNGAALLEDVITGTIVAGAHLARESDVPGGSGAPIAITREGDDYVANGIAFDVPDAGALQVLLVAANMDGDAVIAAIPTDAGGVETAPQALADGSSAGHVTFNATRVDASNILATGADAQSLIALASEHGTLASAAYLVGIAEQAFDVTLEYLKTRQQFGKAIGSFQALQHRAVDLFIQKSLAAAVLEETLDCYDRETDPGCRQRCASRAKYRASEAALQICRQAVQLHGGMGYTDECDVGLFLNRALVLSARYGNATHHARSLAPLVMQQADDDGGDKLAHADIAEPDNGDWDSISDDAFRHIVRRFLEAEYPESERYPSRRHRWEEIKPWYMTLSRKGWVAPAWPAEHGGMGLSPSKLMVWIEELERWGVGRAPDMGVIMVGPLLIQHGTPEQQAQYLPSILAGEHIWCQGYSEPNAGSDLASLRTEALPDGDEFVINGQKTWTTLAQDATHMFCLARTSKEGKQQEGISFFLIDFKQPGVTIRPIKNIAGHEEFCEVFLDDVRVPADALVGDINQGWTIAKALLGFERIFLGSPKQSQYAIMRLGDIADAARLFDDAAFADTYVRLKLDVLDLESIYQRYADMVRRGEPLGPDVSMLKVWATETFARITELMVETAGTAGARTGKIEFGNTQVDVLSQFYNARPATIYGGSNEIQRNIVAKGVLRLPS